MSENWQDPFKSGPRQTDTSILPLIITLKILKLLLSEVQGHKDF